MSKWVLYVAAFVLYAHGLVHLIGPVLYLRLAGIKGFTYKTTLLGGRWELGSAGIGVFGGLWVLAAIGFVVAATAMLLNSSWWLPVLLTVTLFSLVLTGLDSSLAFAGVAVNVGILVFIIWSWRSSL